MLLHEWECREDGRPRLVTDDMGREGYDREVTFENVITWVYDRQSFTPVAKVTEQERYTIVHDYLGTPTQAYDSKGKLVWEMLLDVYGNAKEYSREKCFIPFRYQGQYEDEQTELYYNRFRYYSYGMGMYISSDPIGLAGNNPTLYGYVNNVTIWLDPLGTKGYSVYALYEKGASNPYYIGITKQDIDIRMEQHMKTGRYSSNTIHRVLQSDITIEKKRL